MLRGWMQTVIAVIAWQAGLAVVAIGIACAEAAAGEIAAPADDRLLAGPTAADLLQYADAANPAVRAAREAVTAARHRRRLAASLQDPALTLNYMPLAVEDLQAQKWGIMISQAVPFPGTLAGRSRVFEAEEETARLEFDRTAREVRLRIRESWHELHYLAQARALAGRTGELLQRLRAAGEAGYARESAAFNDLAKAASQEAQVAYDELLLRELESTERARLNALLDRAPDAPFGPLPEAPDAEVAYGFDEILVFAAASSPEILLAAAEIRRSGAEAELARFEARPEIMLGLGYEYQMEAVPDGEPMEGVNFQLGLSLPLWTGKNAGRAGAARAVLARADALRAQALADTRGLVRDLWFRLENARRLRELYRERLLPEAGKAVDTADARYRLGQGSLTDFVETGIVRYNFQLAAARARADHGRYLARLEFHTGRPLTRVPDQPSAPAVNAAARDDDDSWTAAIRRLEEERVRMERDLAAPAPAESFHAPAPALLRVLGPAADDPQRAAEILATRYELATLEVLALLRSPAVAAAQQNVRAALEGYDQVAYLEDGLRQYAGFTSSLMTGAGAMTGGLPPAMTFPYPGLLALKAAIVREGVHAAREELEIARRDAVTEGRRIFWRLIESRQVEELLRQSGEQLRTLEETARSRYEVGKGGMQDVIQARVEREILAAEETSLLQERAVIRARLRALLDLSADAPLGEPVVADPRGDLPDVSAIVPVALARRQELRRLRAMAARMDRMLAMSEKEVLPDVSQGYAWFEDKPFAAAGTDRMAEPFPPPDPGASGPAAPPRSWSGKDQAYLRETRERLAAIRLEIHGLEQATAADLRDAWYAVDRARREHDLYRTRIAELTHLGTEIADRGYRSGTGSLREVLETARARLEAGIEAARRRTALGIALAELDAIVGTTHWREGLAAGHPAGDEP